MTSGGSGGRFSYRLVHMGPIEPLLRRISLLACFGLLPRVLGRRHVPRGPLVVTGTHVNRQDVPLLAVATGRHLEFVASEHFLGIPVYGAVAAWGGWYPLKDVGFGFATENAEALDRAAAAVRRGAAVAIFAQGFTTNFGSGAVRIGAAAGAPVLPIFTCRVHAPPASPRALVVVQRPLPPPAPDARSRRRFQGRLRRRMHALGALRPEGDAERILAAALDDKALWRDPLRVVRLSSRLARRGDAALGRKARGLLRACRRLGCSVGDLRDPAGLAHLVAFLLLLPVAIVGVALVSPPLLALLLRLRGQPPVDVRTAFLRLSTTMAMPWGLVLAVGGWLVVGAWGLALPLVAVAGACSAGIARCLARRIRGSVAVRRHGHRLRARLTEFDGLVARCSGSR